MTLNFFHFLIVFGTQNYMYEYDIYNLSINAEETTSTIFSNNALEPQPEIDVCSHSVRENWRLKATLTFCPFI